MPGYTAHMEPYAQWACTLIHKSITSVQHHLVEHTHHCILTELLPAKPGTKSTFVLNVYCSPGARTTQVEPMIRKALRIAGPNPLVVAGDFNRQHRSLEYATEDRRGKEIWETMEEEDLLLHNSPSTPSRIGISVQGDTTPTLQCLNMLLR